MIEIIEVLPDQPGIAHDPCRVEDSIERAESEPGFDDQSLNVFTRETSACMYATSTPSAPICRFGLEERPASTTRAS